MMATAITLLLCSQLPYWLRVEPVKPATLDLMFVEAQEEFVHAATQPSRWEDVLTPAESQVLRRLGCTHYACRADAQHDLRLLPDFGHRVLIWGRWSRDAETKEYCESRWRALFFCPRCGGTGLPTVNEQWCDVCTLCYGTGDVRAMGYRVGYLPDEREIYEVAVRPLPTLKR